jgi:hypothetical protein
MSGKKEQRAAPPLPLFPVFKSGRDLMSEWGAVISKDILVRSQHRSRPVNRQTKFCEVET